jgi:hypothetical protein
MCHPDLLHKTTLSVTQFGAWKGSTVDRCDRYEPIVHEEEGEEHG